ncbi:MAG TPA: carboxymuconolactone decarboxylase family protein [Xanthobacteraceae bacterium]|nr:carboxymuconolactone decarboxylase family protein [Xanthobacteraceae bacterium]
MDQRVIPSLRIAPLPPDPELSEPFEAARKSLGFIPNSLLIMQRKPKMVKAWAQMSAAVWDPESKVDRGFKRLIAHVASRAAGCQYCMAHTIEGAMHFGVDERKVSAVWDYQTSPLFSEAERVALDVAVAASAVPNAVTDGMFADMCRRWTDEQIVEIVGVIAVFGFLNRWNDTMGTPLEDAPLAAGEKYLAGGGWTPGKHRR